MINRLFIQRICLCLMLCVLLFACTTERDPCLQPQHVVVRLRFYQQAEDTGSAFKDTLLPNMLINPLDTPLVYTFYGVKGVSAVDIPLSPHADSCRWYIQPDSAQSDRRDTITFYYERRLHFISNACGYTYYYSLGSVTTQGRSLADTIHSIDSVILADREVNGDAGKEHVKLYFHR